MTFKQSILGAVSASGILLAFSAIAPLTVYMATPARADTNISVNFGFGTFYDRLQPYGDWVYYQNEYVFIPLRIDASWRPYTRGHWAYTERYGWLWVSSEPFGWATYHYGRWGYARDIGWYWVPGRRWAPAWVAWNRSEDAIAWAPLPPHGSDDVNVSITVSDVPDYYWQAVPTSAFLSINLSNRIIRDRDRVRTIVERRPPETVRIENNVVVNNVIQVNDIERATNTKVRPVTERTVNSPDAVGKSGPGTVAIFNPEVKADAGVQPKKSFKVEDVIANRKSRGIQPQDTPSEPGSTTDKIQNQNNGSSVNNPNQPPPPTPGTNNTTKSDLQSKLPVTPKTDSQNNQGENQGNNNGAMDLKKGKHAKDLLPGNQNSGVNAQGGENPMGKPKRNKSFGNPPSDNGINANDANGTPVQRGHKFNRNKAGDNMGVPDQQLNGQSQPMGQPPKQKNFQPPNMGQQKNIQPNMGQQPQLKNFQPPQNGQQPKGQNGKKPVNKGQPCDPNSKDCPPAQ